jgi:hypothetical protein
MTTRQQNTIVRLRSLIREQLLASTHNQHKANGTNRLNELRAHPFVHDTNHDQYIAFSGADGVVKIQPAVNGKPVKDSSDPIQKMFGHPPQMHNHADFLLSPETIRKYEEFVSQGLMIKQEETNTIKDYWISNRKRAEPGSLLSTVTSQEEVPTEYTKYYIKSSNPTNGFTVDHKKHVIDLSTAWLEYLTRRPGGKPGGAKSNTTYVIPSGDVAFEEKDQGALLKLLRYIMQIDPRVTGDYAIVNSEKYYNKTVAQVLGNKGDKTEVQKALDPSTAELWAYHGTSDTFLKSIQRRGLVPGQARELYVDLIPGYSDKLIYMTFSPSEAENYATRAAVWYGGKPTVLKVKITDTTKIMPDEDTMGWIKLPRDFTIKKSTQEQDWRTGEMKYGKENVVVSDQIHTQTALRILNKDRAAWDQDEEMKAFSDFIKKAIGLLTKESVKAGVFGYKGAILPSNVSLWRQYPKTSYGPNSKDVDKDVYDAKRKETVSKMKRYDQ